MIENRMTFKLKTIGLLLILAINAFALQAQNATFSIPDSLVNPGDELQIAVNVSEFSVGDTIFSGEMQFTISSNLVSIQGVSTEGSILDGVSSFYNATNRTFAFASTVPVTGDGHLLTLNVKVSDNAVKFQQATIGITNILLNEDITDFTVDSGTFTVKGIAITPSSPSGTFIAGQTRQFNLTGDIVHPVVWTSSADSVATVSDTGLVEGLSAGSVRIFAVDAEGKSDSTNIFRVEPSGLQDLTVGVSNTSATQTLTGIIQVNINDVTGFNITSGQFDLVYNASRIEILDVTSDGTLLQGRPDPIVSLESGRLRLAFADATPLEGEGALVNVVFRVFRNATGSVTVTPQNVLFNENISAATSSGTITILNAPVIVVNQPEPEFTIGETMNFSVVSGGNAPYRWESDNPAVAVIDENTGVATALSRGVANIKAIDADDFESELMALRVNDVTASIPDFSTFNYDVFELPLDITDLTGRGITSYEVDLSYDTAVLNFDQVITAGTMSDGLSLFSSAENGVIKIAVASATPIEGTGDLFRLSFSFAESVTPVTNTQVQINRVQFNEPGSLTPTATRRGGVITLTSEQVPAQVVLSSPENEAVDISRTPVLSWYSSNQSDSYLLELATDEIFTNEILSVSVADTFYTTPLLDFETVYYWRVRGQNTFGSGSSSSVFRFTTLSEPVAPGIDAAASTVTATTPHFATGVDSSLVTVVIIDTEGNPMSGFTNSDFVITLIGSAQHGFISETATVGTYQFSIANSIAENVLVIVEVNGTELIERPTIIFEPIPPPQPPLVELINLTTVENGLETTWQIDSESFQGTFNIYRGISKNQLQILSSVGGSVRSYVDTNPPQGSIFYAISAVNEVENEGILSNILTFVQQTVQATTDWQLISIPVNTDSVVTQMATLFRFNAGYSVTEKLEPAFGYWIKTSSNNTESYPVNAPGLDSLTVTLNTGWNLIGSVTDSVHKSLIDDPENILSEAPIYTFSNGMYQGGVHIIPQNGHWIHANQPGTISFNIYSEQVIIAKQSEHTTGSNTSRLKFSTDGHTSDLLISDEPLTNPEKSAFLLPPVAPDPVLDVRLANQTRIIDSHSSVIRLITKKYPVQVEMINDMAESSFTYRIIMKSDDNERSVDLIPGRVHVIDKEYDVIEVMKIHSDEIIAEHRLMPNYPNPFNPTTTLHYYLNENTNVTLEVFDLLGRKVSELYSGPQLSGEYRINFDARNLASGIYIVRFKAGTHVDIRRISLIK